MTAHLRSPAPLWHSDPTLAASLILRGLSFHPSPRPEARPEAWRGHIARAPPSHLSPRRRCTRPLPTFASKSGVKSRSHPQLIFEHSSARWIRFSESCRAFSIQFSDGLRPIRLGQCNLTFNRTRLAYPAAADGFSAADRRARDRSFAKHGSSGGCVGGEWQGRRDRP